MEPRLSFVTLAVPDIDAARRFYCDGLGWPAVFDDGDDVVMIQVGEHLVLSLWSQASFEAEVGSSVRTGDGVAPLTLAHNVRARHQVDDVLEEAKKAGASQVTAPQERVWGGYTGYFRDPAGFLWEVAWNPGQVGRLVVPEVAD